MSENFKRYLNVFEMETELPGSGKTIRYKPITVGQIKKLLVFEKSEDESVIEKALDDLISECVITNGFNVNELFIQDRFYLLMELRIATKGPNYKFTSRCHECGSQTIASVDLNKLVVKKLNKELIECVQKKSENIETREPVGMLKLVQDKEVPVDVKKQPNYIQINDNIGITLNLLTRNEQKDIMNLLTKYKGKMTDSEIDAEYNILTLATLIDKIISPAGADDNIGLEDKVYFIENLLPPESEKISSWLRDNNFGVDFKFKVKCIHCKNEVEREIPLENFFY